MPATIRVLRLISSPRGAESESLRLSHLVLDGLGGQHSLEVQDVDLAWLRAVAAVHGESGHVVPYVVVTRTGWRDPRSGASRTWVRLRQR